jgi:hypothetical protein
VTALWEKIAITTTVPVAPLTKMNDETAIARSSFIVFLFQPLGHAGPAGFYYRIQGSAAALSHKSHTL